jgi:hypothetical protein
MDDDLKKNWWIIVAVAMVVLIGTYVATPTANKIKSQKAAIDGQTYTVP